MTPTLNAQELAQLVGRHPKTILKWAHLSLIPCIRRNQRIVLFNLEEVQSAMLKNRLKEGTAMTKRDLKKSKEK